MTNLKNLLQFTSFLHKFQQVKRGLYATGENRRENDAEHSYQLAMIAWYLLEKETLDLKRDLVLEYALVHDLVEVYAGDTAFYKRTDTPEDKEAKEAKALKELEEEFPQLKSIHRRISEYEAKETEESRFVYALDKLIPILNVYLDDGRDWKENDITLKMITDYKVGKVDISPVVQKHFSSLVAILKDKEDELFNASS